MKLAEALALAKDQLTEAKVPSPEADAYWLLAHALDASRAALLSAIAFDQELTDEQFEKFRSTLENRSMRIPLQHITGKAAFRALELKVGPGVFIPRFETEQVAQIAIDYLRLLPATASAVDVGTGSGAIAISLAKETTTKVYAIELSQEAAKFAAENIVDNSAEVELMVGSFEDLLPKLRDLDLLISNPPYIPSSARPIDPEVRDHDPDLALYSGEDGLDAIRELVALAPLSLRRGGLMVLEHADGQSDQVRELLLVAGFGAVTVHPDPTGRLRAVSGIRRG
jgi:release factor glutamine methyltransferase